VSSLRVPRRGVEPGPLASAASMLPPAPIAELHSHIESSHSDRNALRVVPLDWLNQQRGHTRESLFVT